MSGTGTASGRFKRPAAAEATLVVGFDGSPCAYAAIRWASRMLDDDGRLVIAGVAPPASGESQRIGSVAYRLLQISDIPVIVVPRTKTVTAR